MDLSTDPTSLSALFVAPECAPLVKTGGLGDVCAALPAALRRSGVDARILIPGYREVLAHAAARPLARMTALGFEVRLRAATLPDGATPLLVVDCPELYARPGGPYQREDGADWPDNALRFGVLCNVAAQLGCAASPLPWRPQVVHCNDWPTGLAPLYLKLAPEPAAARSLLTIHNLAFQGNFAPGVLEPLHLPGEAYSVESLEFYGRVSFLKGGIVHADALTTVSPTYAREIQTEALGCGMEGILRTRADALSGILNGVDAALWQPATDALIAAPYDAKDLSGKAKNKAALQKAMGLPVDAGVPLFGTVGRMTKQKGTDLIAAAAPALAAMGQVVILGSGDVSLEQEAKALEARQAGRIAVRIGFSEALAHLVEAGADFFLMPSRYEPCGLNQMYSQAYGTPPIARRTGGLADTITDGESGFLFDAPEAGALLEAARRAVARYRDPPAWQAMQRAGMARDFSWDRAARRYADLYLGLATRQAA